MRYKNLREFFVKNPDYFYGFIATYIAYGALLSFLLKVPLAGIIAIIPLVSLLLIMNNAKYKR